LRRAYLVVTCGFTSRYGLIAGRCPMAVNDNRMQSTAPETIRPVRAGLARRVGAMFYDSLLVFAVTWTVTAAVIGMRVWFSGAAAIQSHAERAASGLLLQIPLILAVAGFFVWFWTRSGQTLGMQSWRLRLETEEGELLDARQALARLGIAILSFACLGLGYWWILVDPQRRAWHDRLTNTRVVVLPKR